jgi:hypothetical protein
MDNGCINKNATLLSDNTRRQKPNPLPWDQLSIVLLLQICGPLTGYSIYPYITQVVRYIFLGSGRSLIGLAYQRAGYHRWE